MKVEHVYNTQTNDAQSEYERGHKEPMSWKLGCVSLPLVGVNWNSLAHWGYLWLR